MDEAATVGATRTPVHLWIVGILALCWNAFGCVDYVMTETHNEAWLAMATPEVRTWIDATPAWMIAFWALGVWGGLLGSLLLVLRNRHAVEAYALSLIGATVSLIYQVGISPMPGADAMSMILPVVIVLIAGFLLYYARSMRAKGVLH